jgi:hypothetical protein
VPRSRLKAESLTTLLLIFVGFVMLPCMIYLVGQFVIGEYEGEGGLGGLFIAIYQSLGRGNIATWILVLSPYFVVQLLRLIVVLLRARKPVTSVTK